MLFLPWYPEKEIKISVYLKKKSTINIRFLSHSHAFVLSYLLPQGTSGGVTVSKLD